MMWRDLLSVGPRFLLRCSYGGQVSAASCGCHVHEADQLTRSVPQAAPGYLPAAPPPMPSLARRVAGLNVPTLLMQVSPAGRLLEPHQYHGRTVYAGQPGAVAGSGSRVTYHS